jgi:transcriptional regulator with XRE-family HTH domain
MKTLSQQIREAILGSGLTRYEIAKATGVSQSTLSKFVLGQRGISIEAMDSVGLFLGLGIAQPNKRRSIRSSKRGG